MSSPTSTSWWKPTSRTPRAPHSTVGHYLMTGIHFLEHPILASFIPTICRCSHTMLSSQVSGNVSEPILCVSAGYGCSGIAADLAQALGMACARVGGCRQTVWTLSGVLMLLAMCQVLCERRRMSRSIISENPRNGGGFSSSLLTTYMFRVGAGSSYGYAG